MRGGGEGKLVKRITPRRRRRNGSSCVISLFSVRATERAHSDSRAAARTRTLTCRALARRAFARPPLRPAPDRPRCRATASACSP